MEFTVSTEHEGKRLDVFVTEVFDPAGSRSAAQRLIKAGNVSIDGGESSRGSVKLAEGQVVSIVVDSADATEMVSPSDISLNVAYEDDDIAVIDKPGGMTVHPGAGHTDDTLANAAVFRWPQIKNVGESDRPGIVHRLDRDTSGLMVVALTERAYDKLSQMIRDREISRIYSALVHGIPESRQGVVDAPIGRDPHHRTRQAVNEDGRPSRTHYRVELELGDYALLKIRLETGRMHQIRVHMTAIGHPVIGDQTYGKQKNLPNLHRQFLHASRLEFDHPVTGEPVSIRSELPSDLQRALEHLRT